VQLPIDIMCNTVGAVYLANNFCNSKWTKNIGTHHYFVQEWVEGNILLINFTQTLNNTADILQRIPQKKNSRHTL
jgi:hypothetical protein